MTSLLHGWRHLVCKQGIKTLCLRHSAVLSSGGGRRYRSKSQDLLPTGAQVVVCGGGIVGTSVAYHLTKHGWTDVVLLEQGSISGGSTWHGSGIMDTLTGTDVDIAMAAYSQQFYSNLDTQHDCDIGWKQCGSLYLARSVDRLILYKRQLITAGRYGVEGEVLSPQQVADRYPLLHTDDLEGAVYIPTDGVVNPTDATMAIAKKARESGVNIHEGTKVKRVLTRNNKVQGVETDRGHIECSYFVNCAGLWSRELGQLSEPKVRVPLHPCEHFYIVTKPMDNIDKMLPVIRDYDGYVYLREWSGGLLGGGFEPKAKPVFHDGIPDKFEFQLLPEDWDHFHIILDQLLHRVPALEKAEVRQLLNGPESFTPDGKFIIGEAPEVARYYVLGGLCGQGFNLAPGAAHFLAQWMAKGDPAMNPVFYDLRRFVHLHNNLKFLKERVTESVGMFG